MLKKISASQFSGKDLMTISHRKTKRLLTSSAMKKKYVICGAGLQGTAVAHAFSLMGLGKDTLLLDQGRVGGGTTKYAAGFVGVYKQTPVESMLVKESLALYRKLHDEGHDIGWNQCGSLLLAQTRDRVTAFRRMKAAAVQRDIHCEWLQPEAIEKRYPYLATKDVLAGIFIPEDGTILPEKLCNVLVHQCKANGVTVVENCNVSSILCKAGKVVGAETSIGRIDCDYLINCAGLWARALGKQSRPVVRVPVQACQHHHLVTKQTELATNPMPAIRDMDASVYLRVRDGGFLIGGLEPNAKPVFEDGTPPANWEPKFLEPDWDYFTPSLEKALKRFPALRDVMLERLVCGPETFAPDGKWVVGEAPEVDNYFVAAGMNTMGSSSAGGVGKLIAQWVVEGRAPYPLYALDVQRFLPLHNNRKFLLARAKEVPSWMNQVPYPFNEFRSGRKLRMSPLYARLRDAGAVFGQVMGFERASWYESEENDLDDQDNAPKPFRVSYCNTFMKPPWFSNVRDEYWACRESVTVANYSSFTKFDLKSSETQVTDLLQYLCSNDVDIPVGGVIHTGMQNERGGYENDVSLARINDNHYMMIAPTVQQTKCLAWIRRYLPKDGSVSVSDVTSTYTSICVMGPMSRSLLMELTDVDMSPRSFPFFTCQEIDIGHASGVRAMNLTHVGELGWVLYIPNEYALHVYDRLIEHGKKYGIRHCGWFATRTLRIERFYAFWGQDLDANTTPLECGRAFRVKFNSNMDFLGKEALVRQREAGVRRMYVQLLLEDHDMELDPWPWGGEPIYRDGKYVGMTTTAGYGFTFGKQVCLGFVTKKDRITPDWISSGQYEIDIAGIRFSATVSLRSPTLPSRYKEPAPGPERYAATRNIPK